MDDRNTIPKFPCFGDNATLGTRWKRWLSAFELYADGKGLIMNEETPQNDKQRRRALLLHLAGPDVQDIFLTLSDTGAAWDYNKAVKALNDQFVPQVNISAARHAFRQMSQNEGETMLQFVTRLRIAARDCKYGDDDAVDAQIRDEVIYKCQSDTIRRKLLDEGGDLRLKRVLEVAAHEEEIEAQMSRMSVTPVTGSVNRVRSYTKKGKNVGKFREKSGKSNFNNACYRCGEIGHFGRDASCPARGKTCLKCGGKDHFKKCCKTKKFVNNIESDEPEPEGAVGGDISGGTGYAFVITSASAEPDKSGMLEFNIGGGGVSSLKMLVDSGASTNIIDKGTWEDLKSKRICCDSHKAKVKSHAYASNKPLNVLGAFECEIQAGGTCTQANFIVVDGYGVPLLGRDTAMQLNVLKIGYDIAAVTESHKLIEQMYPDACSGVGKLADKQVHVHQKPVTEVKPVACHRSPTPFHLREKVERKTDELMKLDIIERADDYPTPWVNRTVVVPKPGTDDVRLCLDMREANKAVERTRYPIKTVDEILQNLNGSKVFSKIDLKWGYHQLELDPESRGITTFATHNGLFRYKRLIFGITSASEIYQCEIERVLAGIKGADNISDDIIVHGEDQASHDKALHAVMRRISDNGLTVNLEKCKFHMKELEFFGMLLSEKGIGPTESRVEDILNARGPENISEVRSFLGLATYASRFIPGFATITDPLRKLLLQDAKFQFGKEQKNAFTTIKNRLAHAARLAYFDKKATTKVIADASPVGLGAVLIQMQNGEPVPICYASRALTACEKRYSQTEKEALGIVWACEQFNAYIEGAPLDLVTDHKPLEIIFGKCGKPSARIERWVLRLQKYQYNVVYVPGPKNIADPL